ncbi:Ger(x)C family spore germination protein [Shouchella lonarensis]|uniref:Germination protein, Ger(X)C family n=1 Tax=Shouchella lonarensis TaxID=1464122 RepID=A0A1G6KPG5_9BACI|nr:Ger(x)C family spore germination protein [Shouchella lonarensis]SDC32992.1 germination protein, Ger(x)C family [Shouchella lonarensis]
MILRKLISIACIASLLTLSGCWDQHLLKDVTLVKSAGIDLVEDEKYLVSVTIRSIQEPTSTEEAGVSAPKTMQVESNTIREARDLLDRRIGKAYDSSKLEVLVLGEELAKDDILLLLDVFYRNPRSPLSTKLVISEGEAQDIIKLGEGYPLQIGEYIADLLSSLEGETEVPNENIQSISARLLSGGEDITLPLIKPLDDVTATVVGLALFDGTKYTGKIEHQMSTLFLLMNGQLGKNARFSKKIHDDKEVNIANYITIDVTGVDRDLQLVANSVDDITVKLNFKFDVDVVELPVDVPMPISEVRKLNKKLGDLFTKEAKIVTDRLLEANSDALGIGKRIHAFHHDIWKEKDWKEVYPNIKFETNIEVRIDQQGILY